MWWHCGNAASRIATRGPGLPSQHGYGRNGCDNGDGGDACGDVEYADGGCDGRTCDGSGDGNDDECEGRRRSVLQRCCEGGLSPFGTCLCEFVKWAPFCRSYFSSVFAAFTIDIESNPIDNDCDEDIRLIFETHPFITFGGFFQRWNLWEVVDIYISNSIYQPWNCGR